MITRATLVCSLLLVLALAGCSKNYPVEGAITFSDGRVAAPDTVVIFTSVEDNQSGYGKVGEGVS